MGIHKRRTALLPSGIGPYLIWRGESGAVEVGREALLNPLGEFLGIADPDVPVAVDFDTALVTE